MVYFTLEKSFENNNMKLLSTYIRFKGEGYIDYSSGGGGMIKTLVSPYFHISLARKFHLLLPPKKHLFSGAIEELTNP